MGSHRGHTSSPAARWLFVALAAVASAAIAVALVRPVLDRTGTAAAPATLDATTPARTPGASAVEGVTGQGGTAASTRLNLLGPRRLLDTQDGDRPAAGAEVAVPLPDLPDGTTAVLLEVSLTQARGSGAVTLTSAVAESPVLQVPRAAAMTSATTVMPVGPDGALRVRTAGGGHLVVLLVASFEPATTATAGRVVSLPATRVLDLVVERDGKQATVDLSDVPALAEAEPLAAVLLQISADVGPRGGSIAVGPTPGSRPHVAMWMPTSGTDRVRHAFLVVPVTEGLVSVAYQAGTRLQVDVVGYVTGAGAVASADGLLVPLGPATDGVRVSLEAGRPTQVDAVTAAVPVPAERVHAVLGRLSARSSAVGAVSVHAPGDPPPRTATLTVTAAGPRWVPTLTGVSEGRLVAEADVPVELTLSPQVLVLKG